MYITKGNIVRKIDDLGRIVLPKDIRKQLDIHRGDLIELSCESDILKITKYSSIQAICFVTQVLLDTIYEMYQIEGMLIEEKEILCHTSTISKRKISTKLEEEHISLPLLFNDKEIGTFLLFSKEEKSRSILSFLTLFLTKYLEES